MKDATLIIRNLPNGKRLAEVAGTSFGYCTANLLVLKENDKTIMLKVPSGKAWVGLGTFKYMGPWALVYHKIKSDVQSNKVTIEAVELYGREYSRETKSFVMETANRVYDEDKTNETEKAATKVIRY